VPLKASISNPSERWRFLSPLTWCLLIHKMWENNGLYLGITILLDSLVTGKADCIQSRVSSHLWQSQNFMNVKTFWIWVMTPNRLVGSFQRFCFRPEVWNSMFLRNVASPYGVTTQQNIFICTPWQLQIWLRECSSLSWPSSSPSLLLYQWG
jgi:hypothetical protein